MLNAGQVNIAPVDNPKAITVNRPEVRPYCMPIHGDHVDVTEQFSRN